MSIADIVREAGTRQTWMHATVSAALALLIAGVALQAQQPPAAAMPPKPLPAASFVIDTAEQGRIQVTPIKGLNRPWGLVFLPTGDMLVTEKGARVRVVRNGALDPKPVA